MHKCSRGWSPLVWSRLPTGFTLVELMVTIAVLAILMAIALPNFTALINGSRLTSQANELVASLQYTRSESVRLNRRVTLCPSSDGANCSTTAGWARWIARVDASGEVLRDTVSKGKTTISADVSKITFSSDGLARGTDGMLAAAAIMVCMNTRQPTDNIRVVSLVGGARISVQQQTGTCQ
ncbi:GspH/FimT family pseudopilin [Xanthomonas campestris pv. campestris]|nr:GspH/FimT family pseudopilin [Xanthomonas campestris pv. campestris]